MSRSFWKSSPVTSGETSSVLTVNRFGINVQGYTTSARTFLKKVKSLKCIIQKRLIYLFKSEAEDGNNLLRQYKNSFNDKKKNQEEQIRADWKEAEHRFRQLPEAESKIIIRIFKKGLQKSDRESVSTNNRGSFNL